MLGFFLSACLVVFFCFGFVWLVRFVVCLLGFLRGGGVIILV